MFKLTNVNNKWKIYTDEYFYAGSFKEVMTYCMDSLLINSGELEYAVTQMVQHEHDTSEFGINGTFMYSFNCSGTQQRAG